MELTVGRAGEGSLGGSWEPRGVHRVCVEMQMQLQLGRRYGSRTKAWKRGTLGIAIEGWAETEKESQVTGKPREHGVPGPWATAF